jgi:ubiquinone/menaquinone biosynthesis C-methylase UbiE
MIIKEQYNNFYQIYSENFDLENEKSNRMFHDCFKFELKNKKLLDIGCGNGADLKKLAIQGAKLHGIDPSNEFIKVAQTKNPLGLFTEGVGEKLPFPDNYFDVVTSKWAIQTSPDVPKVLEEMARVLKTGGKLIYLSKHPIIQWHEKIRDYGHGANYYQQMIVTSNIYNNKIVLKEPSHTLGEYFNADFLKNFQITNFIEDTDFPASEQINGDTYPTFFIVEALKK